MIINTVNHHIIRAIDISPENDDMMLMVSKVPAIIGHANRMDHS